MARLDWGERFTLGKMEQGALTYYRGFSRRRLPLVLVVGVVLIWMARQWGGGGSYGEDPGELCRVAERSADVEFALDRQLDGTPAWLRGALDLSGAEEARESFLEELRSEGVGELTQADELLKALSGEAPGEDAGLLAELVSEGGRKRPDLEQWEQLERLYGGGRWWAWEAQAIARLDDANAPEWVAAGLEERDGLRASITFWALLGGATLVVVLLAGLFLLPKVLKELMRAERLSPVLKSWPLAWVVFAFVAVDLAVDLLLAQIDGFLSMFGFLPLALEILLDAGWRIGGTLGLLWLMFGRPRHALRVFGLREKVPIKLCLGVLSALLVFDSLWYPLVGLWQEPESGLMFEEDGWGGLFFALLSGVILAPICEEIVYRGVLFGGLSGKLGFWPAAVISSAVFSLVHHYGVAGSVSIFALGLAGCVMFRRTGSLVAPIVVHAAYNGLITLSLWPVYHGPYSAW